LVSAVVAVCVIKNKYFVLLFRIHDAPSRSTSARNKEKLRQELAQKKRENRNVDPLCLTKHEEEKLDRVSSMVATLEVMETEISKMVQQLEEIEEEDQICKQQPPRHSENESEGTLMLNDGETKAKSVEEGTKDASEGVDTPKAVLEQEEVAHSDTNKTTSDDPSETSQLVSSVDDLQKKEQREQQKMAIVEAILLCLQQTQPLRDNIAQLTKSLYIFRADTSADKIVCEVSGNFMSVSPPTPFILYSCMHFF
jgi:acetolactate synthase small subunit